MDIQFDQLTSQLCARGEKLVVEGIHSVVYYGETEIKVSESDVRKILPSDHQILWHPEFYSFVGCAPYNSKFPSMKESDIKAYISKLLDDGALYLNLIVTIYPEGYQPVQGPVESIKVFVQGMELIETFSL